MMLAENDYDTAIDIISNMPGHALAIRKLNQGVANSTNTSFQFENMMLHASKNIAAYTNSVATSFILPQGTVSMVTRNDALNLANEDTKIQTYTTVTDPFGLGLKADLHFYETRGDTRSVGGTEQDEIVQWELTLQYAIDEAPLSEANDSTIHKSTLLS